MLGLVWFGMVGLVWFGMVGTVWFGMFVFVWFRLVVSISYLYKASLLLFRVDCGRTADGNRDNRANSVQLGWSLTELGQKKRVKYEY